MPVGPYTLRAIDNLGNSVVRGIEGQGNTAVMAANYGLRRAQDQFERDKFARYVQPGLERENERQRQLDEPVKWGATIGSRLTDGDKIQLAANNVFADFAKLHGGSYDPATDTITGADGKSITYRQISSDPKFKGTLYGVMANATDPAVTLERYAFDADEAAAQAASPAQKQMLTQKAAQARAALKDPSRLAALYSRKADIMAAMAAMTKDSGGDPSYWLNAAQGALSKAQAITGRQEKLEDRAWQAEQKMKELKFQRETSWNKPKDPELFVNPDTLETKRLGAKDDIPTGFVPASQAAGLKRAGGEKPIQVNIDHLLPQQKDMLGNPDPVVDEARNYLNQALFSASNQEKKLIVDSMGEVRDWISGMSKAGKTTDGRPIDNQTIRQGIAKIILKNAQLSGPAVAPVDQASFQIEQGAGVGKKPPYPEPGAGATAVPSGGATDAQPKPKFPDIAPQVSSISGRDVRRTEAGLPPRNSMEAIYGRQKPGKSVVDAAQATQVGSRPRFGETVVEAALRQLGHGENVADRQELAKALREKYPQATDQQIADALMSGHGQMSGDVLAQ